MTVLFWIVIVLLILFAFYGGIVLGITDCKRQYGIGKGVTPEEYDSWVNTLLMYQTGEEV